VLDGRDGGAVAEVATDDLQFVGAPLEVLGRAQGDVGMGTSVKAVSAQAFFFSTNIHMRSRIITYQHHRQLRFTACLAWKRLNLKTLCFGRI
jgi:hypothetical protein